MDLYTLHVKYRLLVLRCDRHDAIRPLGKKRYVRGNDLNVIRVNDRESVAKNLGDESNTSGTIRWDGKGKGGWGGGEDARSNSRSRVQIGLIARW